MKKTLIKILAFSILVVILLLVSIFRISDVKEIPIKEGIRVVSYNIKYSTSDLADWDDRKLLIYEQILDYEPDSIGIQEADWNWMHGSGSLNEYLDEYDYIGVGRTDGLEAGEYAPIFYLKDKWTVVDSGTFWLSDTPWEPSIGWDAVDYRICTWAKLKNIETEEVYIHYNTHLDHVGEEARINAARLIEEVALNSYYPFVITGDFNVIQGSEVYDEMIDNGLIYDSKKVALDTMSHGTINWFLTLNFRLFPPIDFIFVSSDIQPTIYRVDNTYWHNDKPVSDHYPVIIDFYLK